MSHLLLHPRVRVATLDDFNALDALFARSYPKLLRADYPPSTMVTAVPIISRAQPALLATGNYFVAEIDGEIVGAGGWTRTPPRKMPRTVQSGHIRHVVTSHLHVRSGIGRALMSNVMGQAESEGIHQLECLSTRTAVPFYQAMGFTVQGLIEVPLAPGIIFPAIGMIRPI